MMLGARTGAWSKAGGGAPTAKDYVQDGLIAMWDGIENAGWGVHNANAPVWKDLIGGVGDMHFFVSGDGSKTPSTIPLPNEGMCYVSNGETICAAEDVNEFLKTKNNGEYTFEITQIFRERFGLLAQRPILSYINTEYIAGYGNEKYRYVTIGRNMTKIGTVIDNFPHCSCLSICSQPSKGWFYADAELQNTVESSSYSYNYSLRGDSFENGRMPLKLFSNWTGVATTKEHVRISSVRIYDKILSAFEITANYAIDKARFNLP